MLSCHTPLVLHAVVGVGVGVGVGVAVVVVGGGGDWLLCELIFVCFHGCPVLSKYPFVYLF